MRIAHLLPYDPNQPGGVQTHVLALHRRLLRLGHESIVFAPGHPFRLRLGETNADLGWHPSDLLGLRRFLRQPADILHIQEPLLPLLGPLALMHPGRPPTVVTLHTAEAAAGRAYGRATPITRRLLRQADAVVCATRVTLDTAGPGIPCPVSLIAPGFDLDPFLAVRRRPSNDQTIAFVGRDDPRKGLPVLLQALSRVPIAVGLVVIGPVQDSTVRLTHDLGIADRVRFLGPVPHSQLPSLLATAHCAAFPALGGEALGLVLVEAMASGVPVVASDIPGYRLASREGQAAELVPPNDPQALAATLTGLLADQPKRDLLSARGRAAARRFDIRPITTTYLRLYDRVLNTPSTRRLRS